MLFTDRRYLTIFLYFVVAVTLSPLVFILVQSISENTSYLDTIIREGILNDYIVNTLELILKVGILSSFIGFGSAYLITFFDFPLKRFFKVTLTMPLSIPVYVGAYTYAGIYYDMPLLETLLKNDFTMNGSVFIYTIFLYPYVYLAARSYLKNNLGQYVEASSTLGYGQLKTFWRVVLPMSRPIIIGSVLFVLFETLSDFAVVNFYGVQTLSKAIGDSWLGIGQIQTAAKISLVLLFILTLIIYLERLSRGQKRYFGSSNTPIKRRPLSIFGALPLYIPMILVIMLGFILPVSTMIGYALSKTDYFNRLDILSITFNTLFTTTIVITLILVIASIYSSILNNLRLRFKQLYTSVGIIGYSVPSLILAIGAYVLYIQIDQFLYRFLKFIGLDFYIFTQTRILLVIVLVVKFIAVANVNFSASLSKYDAHVFEASNTLGHNHFSTILRVNIPLLMKSYKYVVLILFIDLIKELTLSYSLRPFNFKTLSTEVYRYAGNEMIEVAAYPALVIVSISAILILLLERNEKDARNKKSHLWLYKKPHH